MILNLIVLLVIILLTLYLSTQGVLSAALALITATFASILAMALFEFQPLEMLCGNFRPEYARGVTFLILFFLAFSGVRIGADFAVPKNIVLPPWIDRISGGVVGFFAALVVIGTTIIGIEMLPIPTTILMYDRFPAKAEDAASPTRDRMQIVREEGGKIVDLPGVAPQKAIWFAPDRFVLWIWDRASAGGLGGATAFESRHPDLSAESYGYRNVVETGAAHALLDSLVHVTAAYRDKDPADLRKFGLPEFADETRGIRYHVLVIRTDIDQGSTQPHISADIDSIFRITPTQLRLVAANDKGDAQQYYPIGYLEKGTIFRHTSLASAHLVEEYATIPNKDDPKASPRVAVIHDWVFPIREDEKPTLFEIKELTRLEVPDSSILAHADTAPRFGVASDYPPRKYRDNPATLTLTLETMNPDKTHTPLAGIPVFILTNTVQKRYVDSKFSAAYDKMLAISDKWDKNEGGWGDQLSGKPGVPGKEVIVGWIRRAIADIKPAAPADFVPWSAIVPMLLYGELTPDGLRNLDAANRYYDESLVPLISASKSFVQRGVTGPDGKFTATLSVGSYTYIARAKTGEYLAIWCKDFNAAAKAKMDEKRDTSAPDFKVDLRIQK